MSDLDQISAAIGALKAQQEEAARQRREDGKKLDILVEKAIKTEEHLKTLNGKVASHEKQLNGLNAFRWKMVGWVAGVGLVAGGAAEHIKKIFL